MESKRKKIAIITGTESTKERVVRQLTPLFSDYVDIESYATDSKNLQYLTADLVVITSPSLEPEAAPFIGPDCKIIFARRALDFSSIEKLYSIPEGTEVLVVNDDKDTAEDVINLINEVGIDHIRLIPYYPWSDLKVFPETAITPGEPQFAPPGIKKLIDIGPRIIDLTTVVEILQTLDLLDEKAHYVSAKYFETIVRLGKQLYQSNFEHSRANENLNKVLNQVNDGILAFTKDGKITVFNQRCEEIFKTRCSAAIGKGISKIIRDKGLSDFMIEKFSVNDHILKIGDSEFAVSRFFADKLDSYVVTFKNTKEIAEIESKMRKNLIKKGHIGKYNFSDIIHNSDIMFKTIETAKKIAKTELSTLIYGESGTGKELFSSSIHNSSLRESGPYLAVNFSALPEELVESELFGYEEGAFTGAKKGGRIGLFEQATGGTIFLDEIGDTSLKIQARLLRVLQEKEIMKVGGSEIIPVDVRVIAATNKDLMKMCQEGKFREDLYYRLKKLSLTTPALRKRKGDIEVLIQYFIKKNNRNDIEINNDVLSRLTSYHWPGNVRELENTVEYMLAVCDGKILTIENLPQDIHPIEENACSENSYYEELNRKGSMEEFLFILRTIESRQKSGIGIGRKALSQLSISSRTPLSEEQVRNRTDILLAMDLIVKNRGRGGMRITSKGLAIIN